MIDINAKEVVAFTNKLERMHRSALPIAVRGTLNDAAFDHRQESIKQFKSNFIIRKQRFIDSHMKVNKSQNTFDISKMSSETGVQKGKSDSGDELEKQEYGGFAFKRNIPTTETRINESMRNLVSKRYYYEKYKDAPLGHNPSQKGIKVKRRKKITFIKKKDRLISVTKGGQWRTLYYLDRKIKITEDKFIAPAAVRTNKKLFRLYKDRARAQFKKVLIPV